jgi:signal transduction histidine kinase
MSTPFDDPGQVRSFQIVRPVLYRLMTPLCIISILLLAGFAAVLIVGERQNLRRFDQHISTDALRSFDASVERQTRTIAALEDTMLNDPKLYEALWDRDRDRLYALYAPLYQKYKERYALTHFYFHLPDRVNLLRVHKPDFFGDHIDRYTAREAERLHKMSAGLELGPLGTFTLRVVQPVFADGILLGYLELGQEIDGLWTLIHKRLGVEVAVSIRKQTINRQQWEAGMKMLGRPTDWDRYKDEVLIYHSLSGFPSECDRFIHGASGHEHDRFKDEVRFDNRIWRILTHSLHDVSGAEVGDLLILRDITEVKTGFFRFAVVVISLALVLLAGVIVFFYVMLRRTDQGIQAQQSRLVKSEEAQRSLLDAINRSGLFLLVVDTEYRVRYMNDVMIAACGDQVGKLCYRDVAGYDEPCTHCQLHEIVGSAEKTIYHEFTMAGGRTYEMIAVPCVNSDGSVFKLEVMRDITEQKQTVYEKGLLEQKLQRAGKMEAIGLLASGVAHDLNNILSGIVSYPELLLMQLPADSPLRPSLHAIMASGQRAAAVVADLLTVARGVACEKKTHDLNMLAQEYLDSPECRKLKSLYPQISWQWRLDAVPAWIRCSPLHVKKIIMNLVTNGAEAIGGDGVIEVSTVNQRVEDGSGQDGLVNAGEYVVLRVRDSGPGISEEDKKHIFEPFYSRKALGRSGTGLGLAIVWNAIHDHEGAVTVDSSEQGTCFTLYFPISSEPGDRVTDKIERDDFSGNNEHILVVDDEPQLRDIASQMLHAFGYKVDSVCSGEQAVQFVRDNGVDLIVMDMQMGSGMNGRQAYEEIVTLRPGQKAIIASGFSESDDVKNALQRGAGGFIKKPYSMEQLGQAVKEALGR